MKRQTYLITARDLYIMSVLGSFYRALGGAAIFAVAWMMREELANNFSTQVVWTLVLIGVLYVVVTFFLVFYLWYKNDNENQKLLNFFRYAKSVTVIDLTLLSLLCIFSGCYISGLYVFFIPIMLYAPFVIQNRNIALILGGYISIFVAVIIALEAMGKLEGANLLFQFWSTHRRLIMLRFFIPAEIVFALLFTVVIIVLKRRMENNFVSLLIEKERHEQLQNFLEKIVMSLPQGIAIFKNGSIKMYNNELVRILKCEGSIESVDSALKESGLIDFINTLATYGEGSLSDIPYVAGSEKKILELTVKKIDEENILVIIEDITGKKLQEKRTREAEANMLRQDKLATIGQMAAGIAHELNNPIAGISSYAQLLLHKFEKNREVTDTEIEKLKKIISNTDRVTKLITNLLQFSKPSTSKENLDINKVIGEVVSLFEYQFKKLNVKMFLDLQPNLPKVEFDRTELEEIIVNLLQNALQFLDKEEKWIRIETAVHEGREVEIVVEDNGKGIPEDQLDRIFSPFYTTRQEGTGLGLSIISNILEKNNGSIMVTSKEGKGSRFVVRIPIPEKGD